MLEAVWKLWNFVVDLKTVFDGRMLIVGVTDLDHLYDCSPLLRL